VGWPLGRWFRRWPLALLTLKPRYNYDQGMDELDHPAVAAGWVDAQTP